MRRIVPILIVLAAFPVPARAAGDPNRDVLWAALKACARTGIGTTPADGRRSRSRGFSRLAIFDCMAGDTNAEDGRKAELSPATPENRCGNQDVWMRGNSEDHEAEAPTTALSEMASDKCAIAIVPVP